MTFESLIRSLRAFSRRRPFMPFLIQLMNSELITISHPEAWRASGELIVLREANSRQRMFDSWSVLQLLELPVNPPEHPEDKPNGEVPTS